uniref:Uncharacterized protein n=1 Tax=Arundo donax TaxID=35708 RepID=A0A0A9F6A0_ARUDO
MELSRLLMDLFMYTQTNERPGQPVHVREKQYVLYYKELSCSFYFIAAAATLFFSLFVGTYCLVGV